MNYNFIEYLIMFVAGVTGLGVKYYKGLIKSVRMLVLNVLIVISIVFFIVPAISEYYGLSLKTSCFIVWVLSAFNDKLMTYIEAFFDNKINNINKE